MQRLIPLIAILALVALTWLFLGQPNRTDRQPADSSQQAALASGSFAGLPTAATRPKIEPDSSPGPATPAVPLWTRERVAQVGLLGRDLKWVETLMDTPFWSSIDGGPGRAYRNQNGVVVRYIAPAGSVTEIRARFPRNAMSADLTALSEYMIGNSNHLPMHFEAYRRPGEEPRFGDFQDRDGRRLYYRGVLRTTGDPPFGPEEFFISTAPFEGQPVQLEPHKDEHLLPRRPVPIDAGTP